jgi:hypothetical protein
MAQSSGRGIFHGFEIETSIERSRKVWARANITTTRANAQIVKSSRYIAHLRAVLTLKALRNVPPRGKWGTGPNIEVAVAYRLHLIEEGIVRTVDDVLTRVRAEYLEMPGLKLTVEQVERLCGIERTLCQSVLDSLVETKFLCVGSDGTYVRSTGAEIARPHALRVDDVMPRRTPDLQAGSAASRGRS